jgi:hypothetical protein
MTVYVLTHQDVSDDGTFTDVIKVYDNKEKAVAAFKVRVEQYEEYYDKEGYEIAEDEGYFELWKEGYWTTDHVVIKILEEEVR